MHDIHGPAARGVEMERFSCVASSLWVIHQNKGHEGGSRDILPCKSHQPQAQEADVQIAWVLTCDGFFLAPADPQAARQPTRGR